MKNIIYSNYNILVENLNKDNQNYYFYYNNDLFIFCIIFNDVDSVLKSYKYAMDFGYDCFNIIYTKDNKIFCEVDTKKYALLKVKGIIKYQYTYKDFNYCLINDKGLNWGDLWGKRLDYYEIQIRELGFKYQTVLNTFGLFHGLAENAILYFNLTINNFTEKVDVGIVHNRINYPCYLIDYNNPLNYIIDYNIRDISEYIKSYLFSKDNDIENVMKILHELNVNDITFNLLYSRLLYPSFYFDIFDNIILENGKDNDVVEIVQSIDKYLSLLKSIYENFNNKYRLFRIEWLDKIKM